MSSRKKIINKIEDLSHPGSRKTLATIRDIKRIKKRDNVKKNFITKVSTCVFENIFEI